MGPVLLWVAHVIGRGVALNERISLSSEDQTGNWKLVKVQVFFFISVAGFAASTNCILWPKIQQSRSRKPLFVYRVLVIWPNIRKANILQESLQSMTHQRSWSNSTSLHDIVRKNSVVSELELCWSLSVVVNLQMTSFFHFCKKSSNYLSVMEMKLLLRSCSFSTKPQQGWPFAPKIQIAPDFLLHLTMKQLFWNPKDWNQSGRENPCTNFHTHIC